MTIEITQTHQLQLTPEFPMYVESKRTFTHYYFKSEDEGIAVCCSFGFASIHKATLEVCLSSAARWEDQLTECSRIDFATAMAQATSIFDSIISNKLLETEIIDGAYAD